LRTHERPAPDRQRAYDETETPPAAGEGIGGSRRALRVGLACHQPLAFHSLEAVGKQLWRDAGQLGTEVLKSCGAPQEVPNDQECPALADQIERLRNRAVLTIPLRHVPNYSRL